jgi:hypothetical protein
MYSGVIFVGSHLEILRKSTARGVEGGKCFLYRKFMTQNNTIQYNTIQYNTIQYNTIQYTK